MKHAYVSVVVHADSAPARETIVQLDDALSGEAGKHEIVLVVPYGSGAAPELDDISLSGPVTIVSTQLRATRDAATLAGLARAVGDFIVEWHADVERLDSVTLAGLLLPTDAGVELVEATGTGADAISRAFYWFANRLRPRTEPVRKVIGRVYSRRALEQILSATSFEPQLNILAAELPVQRRTTNLDAGPSHRPNMGPRVTAGITLLAKSTKFGTAIPLTLSVGSMLVSVGVAVYSLCIFLIRGSTPEGWTTLMVVTGLGQAAILAMLGLTWARIDALTRGLSRGYDATATVSVWAHGKDVAPSAGPGSSGGAHPPKRDPST